jgi:hypothetical protein
MSFYQKLLQSVSAQALLGLGNDAGKPLFSTRKAPRPRRRDRLLRTPLVFETMEPRVLLSGDPLTLAAQQALVAGLQSFEAWTASQLAQAAQQAQLLPVVSTSVGDLVDLPAQIQAHLVQPIEAYFASTVAPNDTDLAAALAADPATAGKVVGQFADGEFLLTLSAFQTSMPISAALNLASDSAGIDLQIAAPPTLSGHATVSMALTFGFDTGTGNTPNTTPTFFIEPTTITESVSLAATGVNGTATLGAADATVTNGAANLSATATVQLKDPLAGDTNDYITAAELSPNTPLSSLVSTSLAGTANLTLPISSNLVAGGPQTLQLNWSGDLSAEGGSNLDSLGAWAQLDTISPSLLQQAVASLPGIIQAAAGSSGFGATMPVLGQNLGQLFDFGTGLSNAATAMASATSLDQAVTALQTNLGATVTMTVNTANNELDMLISFSNAFDTTVPFTINTPVDGATNLLVNGNLNATGTATATIDLGLSFDTALPDQERLVLIQNNSSLGLAFDAITASPVTSAMLGLVHLAVNNGGIAIGAQTAAGADPTTPATATINFNNTTGGRITLAQLLSNFSGSIGAPIYNGAIQANLPLVSEDGSATANLGITWALGQSTPQMTGAEQAANLAVPLNSLTHDPPLNAQEVAGLQTIGAWAAAMTTAADQTGVLTAQMPLVDQTLAQLSGLAPSTTGTFPGFLNEIASAIQSWATAPGASTDNFL